MSDVTDLRGDRVGQDETDPGNRQEQRDGGMVGTERLERIGRLEVHEQPPESLSLLAGDMVHDLRGSLDHMVYQLARLTIDDPTGSQFPIFDDADHYRRTRRGRPSFRETHLVGVPDEYRAFIDDLQPYNWDEPSTHWLSVLRSFSSFDKHRLLNGAYFASSNSVSVTPVGFSVESLDIEYPSSGRVDDGDEIFRFRPTGALNNLIDADQLGFRVDLSLDVVWGPAAVDLETLANICHTTMRVVATMMSCTEHPSGLPHDIEPP